MGAHVSGRRSFVSAFADLTQPSAEGEETEREASSPAPARSRRVEAGAVGAAKRSMTQMREELERLQGMLKGGTGLVEIDAAVIDPSPFADRLADDGAGDFEAFKATIAEQGQKIPIMVRPHPETEGRYQSVFGHRRARALRELERPALAQVVDYSDRELLMAQGIENSARQNLTWIEKALFAAQQTAFGLKAREIRPALGIDDAELSRMRVVTGAIPRAAIETIGRAPKIGRPRWLELATLVKAHPTRSSMADEWSTDALRAMSSDERFDAILSAMKDGTGPPVRPRASGPKAVPVPLADIGRLSAEPKGVRIVVSREHVEGFQAFMRGEADGLVKRYLASLEDNLTSGTLSADKVSRGTAQGARRNPQPNEERN